MGDVGILTFRSQALTVINSWTIIGSISGCFKKSGDKSDLLYSKQNQDNNKEEEDEEPNIEIPEESKVGKKLSELTTKRVIILVLAMMFRL